MHIPLFATPTQGTVKHDPRQKRTVNKAKHRASFAVVARVIAWQPYRKVGLVKAVSCLFWCALISSVPEWHLRLTYSTLSPRAVLYFVDI